MNTRARPTRPAPVLSPAELGMVEMLKAAEHRDQIIELAVGKRHGAQNTSGPPDEVLDYSTTARSLKKTTRTVMRLCDEGYLQRVRFPGRSRSAGVLASSLAALLKSGHDGEAS